MTTEQALYTAGGCVAAVITLLLLYVWRKGRPFAGGDVFRASRWSRGNHLFPTQVLVTPSSVVLFTPQWIGRREESIHIAHVASVRIDTNLLFANVFIETSGGQNPIACYGHTKGDAARIKRLVEGYQSEYFRPSPQPLPKQS